MKFQLIVHCFDIIVLIQAISQDVIKTHSHVNQLTGGGKYSSHLNFFDFCVVTQLYNILS